jgi:predicted RNase H-like HicB family nuclease
MSKFTKLYEKAKNAPENLRFADLCALAELAGFSVMEVTMPKYGFDIFWSEEDQGFIATCPDFPGLSAFGETEEEALREAKIALTLFVEAMNDQGRTIPEATMAGTIAHRRHHHRAVAPAAV